MDELKLSLSTKFMKSMLAKLISKMIKKKYGYKVTIHIEEINLEVIDGQAKLHTNVDAELNSDEFKEIMKAICND